MTLRAGDRVMIDGQTCGYVLTTDGEKYARVLTEKWSSKAGEYVHEVSVYAADRLKVTAHGVFTATWWREKQEDNALHIASHDATTDAAHGE